MRYFKVGSICFVRFSLFGNLGERFFIVLYSLIHSRPLTHHRQ